MKKENFDIIDNFIDETFNLEISSAELEQEIINQGGKVDDISKRLSRILNEKKNTVQADKKDNVILFLNPRFINEGRLFYDAAAGEISNQETFTVDFQNVTFDVKISVRPEFSGTTDGQLVIEWQVDTFYADGWEIVFEFGPSLIKTIYLGNSSEGVYFVTSALLGGIDPIRTASKISFRSARKVIK